MSFSRSPFARFVCAMTSLVMATSPALAEYQFRVPLEPHPVSVGGGTLSISTSSLDFGSVGVGAGRQLFVDVFNSGEGSVTFSGISTTGSHFASSSNCASQLAAGSGCRINVTFSPASTGAATGRLSIRSNDVVAEYAIALSGNGQSGTLSASGLTFPSTLQVGDTAASDSVRVTNIGTAPVAISGVSVATGADSFAQANNCGGTLQPGGYCTINVAFAPAAAGPRAGTIAVTSDADGSPLFIPLFGQGAQASATLTASSFGNEQIGSSKVSGVVLKNTGVGPLAISGMAVTGADYTEATGSASTCSSTLAAGAECQYPVTFTPSAAGPRPGQASATTSAGVLVAPFDGTGVPASADLSAPAFAATSMGGSSYGTATLKNTGIGALDVTVPGQGSVSGAGYSFESTTCSTSLLPGAECSIVVTFAPTSPGASSGTLTVSTGAGVKSVALGSTGIQGIATITPASLQFSSEQVGSTSQFQALTVTNTGTDVLTFTGVGITAGQGEFAQSNDCGSVAVGQSCTVHVNFTPTTTGTVSGTLSFVHNGGGMASVSLSGTGVGQSASINDLAFGGVAVGTQQSLTTTLTNTGVGPLSVTTPTGAAVSGTDFSFVSSTCASTLPVGGACTITVKFASTTAASRSGTLSIATGAGTKTANLTATGQQAVLTFAPSTLGALPSTQVGQTADSSAVTLSNAGNVVASGLQLAAPNGFTLVNSTCGTQLNAGSSCTFNVRFAPTAAQAYSGSLTANADSPSTAASLLVSGTGVSQSAALTDVPFGGIAVGSNSSMTSTLTNTGVGPLSITPPTASSVSGTDFSFAATTCGSTLASGATCTVTVKFTPSAAATRVGTLTVATGAGSKTANLSATGQQAVLSFTPATLGTFPNTQVGQTADSVKVTLSNGGNVTASALSLATTSGYSVDNSTCSSSLNAGSSCTFNVRFAPTAAQTYSGSIAASAAAPATTATLAVSGSGASQGAAISDVSFGNRTANSTTDLTSTLSNTGVGPLSMTPPAAASVTGSGFSFVSTTCGASVAVGESCAITVRFSPTNNSAYSGSLVVVTGAGAKTAALIGQGLQATGIANPSSLNFAATQVAQTAVTQAVTVSNTGNTPLNITGVSISTGATDFAQSNNCGSTLANGSSCTVYVAFTPSATGTRTGTLSMTHDGSGGVTNVSLSGTGQAPSVELTDIDFGDVVVGQSKAGTATLRNTGVGTVSLTQPSAASVTGSGFTFAGTTCGTSLGAGQSCTVNIQAQPTWYATQSGALRVSFSTAGLGTKFAKLTAQGLVGWPSLDQGDLWFDEQPTGTSKSQTLTLSNIGTAPLTVTGISITDGGSDYAQSNNCGAVLQVGESCAIVVQFTPTEVDYRSGIVTILSDSVVTPVLDVAVGGLGTSPGQAVLSLSHPGTHESYGVTLEMQRYVGTSGSIGTFTLTNTGNATATGLLVPATIPSGWSVSASTCASTLAAGASCTFQAVFTPTAAATYTGQLTVSTSSGTAGQGYTLSGMGLAEPWYVFRASDGKVWYRDMSAARTVAAAVTACQQLNYNGTGYRMPNQTEATTFRSQLSANGKLDVHQNGGGDYVMTTTTQASAYRWLTLSTGTVTNKTAPTTGYAYCVRDY